MARSGSPRRIQRVAIVLLALLPALAGCAPLRGPHYMPAGSGVDPYQAVRAQARQFYQAGKAQERQGHWSEALSDYQQASLWDPDNRQDIKAALSRMQARVGAPTSPAPAAPPAPPSKPPLTPTPAAPAQRAAVPTPTAGVSKAGMRSFASRSFPYSISYPRDWLPKLGGTSQQPIDTFVGEPTANIGVMVMVSAEPVGSGATLDLVAAEVKRQLQSAGINDVQLAERRQVSGLPAYVLAYHVTDGSATSSVRHAFFITPGRAWHVIFLAAPGTTPNLLKTFDAMLDSLRLLSPAFPQA